MSRADAVTGTGLDRVDGRLKVTGRASYGPETPVANVAHAVIVGSTVATGTVSLDVEAARRAPGVIAVLTPRNAPHLPGATKKGTGVDRVLQLLQDDVVLYQDQPVALVVAESLEAAQHGATLVRARYASGPVHVEMGSELANAIVPKSAGPSGKAQSENGRPEDGLAAAAAQVRATYTTPMENHNPMEPHGTIAVWQSDRRLTVYDATQGIFTVRKKLATVFDLPPEGIRVISLYVGGGFGCKGSPWSHVALAAMAARVVGRPVKLMLTRHQMFSLVGHRPVTLQEIGLGAKRDGGLTAVRHDVHSATSRFDDFVEPSSKPSRMMYACPAIEGSQKLVRLDIPTPTFMRAPGESSGNFALESAMDELSYALRMDPLALRLRNHADTDPESGKPWGSKSLKACYQQAAERFGWHRRKPAPRSMREGHQLVGWGMATAAYPAGIGEAQAEAQMRADGTALVKAGSHDLGTGTYTIMTQLSADALGLPVHRVRFELGDTTMPETPVSGGSKTAASVGSAVWGAGLALRGQLAALAVADAASPLHGLTIDQIDAQVVDGEQGALVAKSDRGKRDLYSDILKRSGRDSLTATFHAKENDERKKYAHYAFGAQFAEVKVDEDLGEVRVSRMVGAFAAGRILNSKTGRSQLMGGMVWAIGMALLERTVRDPRTGRVVTRDLADYHVPVHRDVPALDIIMVNEVDPHVNDIGAKGIGEIGITGGVAAIANAVYHATGKRVRDLPLTLDKLI